MGIAKINWDESIFPFDGGKKLWGNNQEVNLVSHISSTFLIRVFSAIYGFAFPFAMVSVYGVSASGTYIYLYGIATFIAYVCIWGRNISIYAINDIGDKKYGSTYFPIYVVSTMISIVTTAVSLLLLAQFSCKFYRLLPCFEGNYIIVGLMVVFIAFQFMLVEIFRIQDKFWLALFISNGFVGLCALALIAVSIDYQFDFFVVFLLLSATVFCCVYFFMRPCFKQLHWARLAQCLLLDKNSFHIGLVSVASLVLYQIDIIIVGFYFGTEELAPFAIGSRLGMAINFFNTLVFSYAPKMLSEFIAKDKPFDFKGAFRPQLRMITLIASTVYLCIVFFVCVFYDNEITVITVILYGISSLINLSLGPRSLIMQLTGKSHVQSIITISVSGIGLFLLNYVGTLSIIMLIPITITVIQIAQCILEYIALGRTDIKNVTVL